MQVYLDCSSLTNEHISGIGVYNKNLFRSLKNRTDCEVTPVLKWSRFKKSPIVEKHLDAKVTRILPFLFKKDVLYHGTDHKLNTRSSGPTVVTVHDMQPFERKWLDPKFAALRCEVLRRVINCNVSRIIAVSEFTKDQIIKYFPKASDKIDVVYHGYDFCFDSHIRPVSCLERLKKLIDNRPFLFFIGNLEERKNLINQIKAFEILKHKHKDLIFIISGKPGFNYKLIEDCILSSSAKDSIILTGYLTDDEKDYAMAQTQCLMFASWYEGFGIPVIEALSKNTNLIISNTTSLSEIGKDYCLQVNPADVEEIAFNVERIFMNGNPKKVDLEEWRNTWSWDNCAQKTMDVYKRSYI